LSTKRKKDVMLELKVNLFNSLLGARKPKSVKVKEIHSFNNNYMI